MQIPRNDPDHCHGWPLMKPSPKTKRRKRKKKWCEGGLRKGHAARSKVVAVAVEVEVVVAEVVGVAVVAVVVVDSAGGE